MNTIIVTGKISIDNVKKEVLTERKLRNLLVNMIKPMKHCENDLQLIKNINKPEWDDDTIKEVYTILVRNIFKKHKTRFYNEYVKDGKNYEVYSFHYRRKRYYYTLYVKYANSWDCTKKLVNVYQWVKKTPLEMIKTLEESIKRDEAYISELNNNIDFLNEEINKIKDTLK